MCIALVTWSKLGGTPNGPTVPKITKTPGRRNLISKVSSNGRWAVNFFPNYNLLIFCKEFLRWKFLVSSTSNKCNILMVYQIVSIVSNRITPYNWFALNFIYITTLTSDITDLGHQKQVLALIHNSFNISWTKNRLGCTHIADVHATLLN